MTHNKSPQLSQTLKFMIVKKTQPQLRNKNLSQIQIMNKFQPLLLYKIKNKEFHKATKFFQLLQVLLTILSFIMVFLKIMLIT